MAGKYLGSLLVDKGLLTTTQVDQVLSRQRQTGLPFGQTAVAMFSVRMTDVWRALASQQSETLRTVDLALETSTADALAAIPARFAWASRVLPLRYEGGTLLCATTQKALPDAMAALCERLDTAVRFLLADELQLKGFIMQRYPL